MSEAPKQHPPLCRYCGKAIGKRADQVRFLMPGEWRHPDGATIEVEKRPGSIAEVRRLCSGQVLTVRDHAKNDGIGLAFVWDGVSYKSLFFCNGDHARLFGHAAAQAGYAMAAYTAAIKARTETP